MLNDFLSSLSSRAVQNTEVDSVAGELRPRLATRFEPPGEAVVPMMEATEIDASIDVEMRPTARLENLSQPLQAELPGARNTQARQNVHTEAMQLTDPEPAGNKEAGTSSRDPGKLAPEYHEPTQSKDSSKTRSISAPANTGPVLLPSLNGGYENEPQPRIIQLDHTLAPHLEPDRAIESQGKHDLRSEFQPRVPSDEQERDIPAVAETMTTPIGQPRLVPERIEITPPKQLSPIPAIQSQLLPSLNLEKVKSQKPLPEVDPPPTINVTIGRIEVKAAMPIPVSKPRVAASSTMSLDEYLRRRQGDNR